MIEFKTKKPKIAFLLNNEVEITFNTSKSVIKQLENLQDEELTVQVKKFSKKRSLSQNAYLWVLLDQIGIKTNLSKEQVYKNYVKDYGVFEILPLKNEAVDSFIDKWSKNGLGWLCEDLGDSKLKGYTKIIAYFGSSTYTSEEMQRLLNAVVQDCEELGINTMTLDDIMLLKNDNDRKD